MLDAVPDDNCCRKPLMRALLKDGLCNATEWTCPRCGCVWRPKLVESAVRQWEPETVVAIVK